jgi:hypothetical protein
MRPRREEEEGVSLFPFLSILACVIGALTLLISFLSVVQLQAGDRDPEEVARSTEYQKMLQAAEQQQPLDALAKRIESTRAQQQQLDALRPRVLALRETVTQLTSDDKSVREQLTKVQAELATRKAELERLKAAESAKSETLSKKEAALLAAQLRQQPAVLIEKPPGGVTGNYHFIEANKEGFVLFDKDEPEKVPLAQAGGKRFVGVLNSLKGKQDTTLVYLVRVDGIPAFQRGLSLANQRGLKVGKLPIVGSERVDISLFKRR